MVPGAMPRLESLPDGCAFHPRCDRAEARCRQNPEPDLSACEGRAACWFPLPAKEEAPA